MALARPQQLSITKIVKFDAAHYLPEHIGQCKNLHGHTWKVEIEVGLAESASYDPDKDHMIMDFADLKLYIKSAFLDEADHHCLNDISDLKYPSAENIALWIGTRLQGVFMSQLVRLQRIRVWESEDAYAEWRRL